MEKKVKSKISKKLKGEKDDQYINLLKKIDINLDLREKKTELPFSESKPNDDNFINDEQILSVTDLLSNLEQKNFKTSKIKQQYSDLNSKGVK